MCPGRADMLCPFVIGRFVPQHKVAALQPAARGQEPRGRQPVEGTPIAGRKLRLVNLVQAARLRLSLETE